MKNCCPVCDLRDAGKCGASYSRSGLLALCQLGKLHGGEYHEGRGVYLEDGRRVMAWRWYMARPLTIAVI